jgi:hypothetical protein
MFVFPASFVIDSEGRIRLGVFAEVDWDSPAVDGKDYGLLPAAPC